MGNFEVIGTTDLNEAKVGDRVSESDYAVATNQGKFVQFKYIDEQNKKIPTIVQPGIWSIGESTQKSGLALFATEFVKETILPEFCHAEAVTDRANRFFNKLDIYKKYGVEVPKRGMLLFGPPGSGKSTSIKIVAETHVKDGKTAVILWPTDKFGAGDVRDFIKTFEYKGTEKLILVMEDLGGVEVDQVKMESRSSLLALLDNQEKAFKIPVLLIATTNHIEIFNGNLTNRPGRFSDKIEVGYPSAEARQALFKFFLKDHVTEDLLEKITEKKYAKFSPAHIQEILIRSELYDISVLESLDEILKEIDQYEKMFQVKKQIGINEDYYE